MQNYFRLYAYPVLDTSVLISIIAYCELLTRKGFIQPQINLTCDLIERKNLYFKTTMASLSPKMVFCVPSVIIA